MNAKDELSWAGLAVAETLRAFELALIAIGILIICPPLLILLVIVLVPTIAIAAVVAVIALPVYAVRHFHRQDAEHNHHRVGRLAELGRRSVLARPLAKLGAGRSEHAH
jgi:membrane protein implicated in regulation of membrane protease activity